MDLRSILDWSTDALKAEKLLENYNELEIETSLDDDKEEEAFGTDLDSLY